MPIQLDETDFALLKSLMKDGRKSFRAISRQINVSPPTVKARYERLVNMGLIKSVARNRQSIVDRKSKDEFGGKLGSPKKQKKYLHARVEGLNVKLKCEFCGGSSTTNQRS